MAISAPKRNLMVMALAIAAGELPPAEFRIFTAGENQTTKGAYLFDEQAARDVMQRYAEQGVDVMIDLEHLSLDEESRAFDPDARGWCQLEVRMGELWATRVTWTPDGQVRLSDRRQRYISPVFLYEKETRRITAVLNIAITAMPATHNIAPLVAASARAQKLNGFDPQGDPIMTPEQFAAISEALGLGADAKVEDVLATIAAMVKKIQDAANGTTPDTPADMPPDANAPPALAAASRLGAASRVLVRLSGKKDIGQAVLEVEAWRKSHIELEQNRATLAQERLTLEGGERRRLVGDLVKLGAEAPATAWADDDGTKPAEPWASMAIEALRARVAKLTTKGGTRTPPPRGAPVVESEGGKTVTVRGEVVELSRREVEVCAETGAKLEDYATNKLIRQRAQAARAGA